ncbi:MAG: cytochrome c biogenesis protein CcsA [Actinomycetes bacterium]|jgi:cytochrome c-type biogenesis protein CcmF|nr:cytochrome c biogenesis protein CcsA [Actinomycetes bacterium]
MLMLGRIGLWAGFLAALFAVLMLLIGRTPDKAGRQATRGGFYLTLASAVGMTVAVVVVVAAFMTKDYSFAYVAENHSTDASGLAWLYQLAGLWAGQAGSVLFWTWLMTLFSGYLAFKSSRDSAEGGTLGSAALMVMNAIIVVFCLLMVLTDGNNPFLVTPAEYYVNGQLIGAASQWGMSPLLQHWAMILHPPTLFIGYAGLAVPFAYALGALIVGDTSSRWVKEVDRITVFSWLFLGIGIGLGAVWAYVVLGWGGFWGWDPVENASILPWFVGLALIHSMTVYRRKGNLKGWTFILTAITFVMVVMGTFITRSGVVQSVHMFDKDTMAYTIFLSLMIVSLAAMVIAMLVRKNQLQNTSEFESLTGKDAMYFLNNVIMTLASVIILFMTMAPALIKRTYGVNQYEVIARIVGLIYLAILAICPTLNWGSTDRGTVWSRVKWPLAVTIIPLGLLVWEWLANLRPVYADMVQAGGETAKAFTMYGPFLYDAITLLGFALGSFLIVNTGALFVRGVKARKKATGESVLSSLGTILWKARRQSGGYIAHMAMGIVVIGLIGSVMYVRSGMYNLPNKPGESKIEIADYTFTFMGLTSETLPNGDVNSIATFNAEQDGKSVGVFAPSVTRFAVQGQSRHNASVRSEALRDIFFALGDQNDENVIPVEIKINPLIWLTWIGFALLMVGSALSTFPKKAPVAAPGGAGKKKAAKAR